MRFGEWNINVSKNMPQKVATAMGYVKELLGAEYREIAYIGSQVVNGINHAVLAQQTILSGRDTNNAVLIIFNEKPNDIIATLVEIRTLVESGGTLGGTDVNVTTEIPEDAMTTWNKAFEGFVGSKIEPIALLGTQLVNGVNYTFLVEQSPVVPNPPKKVALVELNSLSDEVKGTDIIRSTPALGYAFTW